MLELVTARKTLCGIMSCRFYYPKDCLCSNITSGADHCQTVYVLESKRYNVKVIAIN